MNVLDLQAPGTCRRCLSHDDLPSASADGVVYLTVPRALLCPAAAGAATGGLDVVARSRNHDLEVEIYAEGRWITLEVRTRRAALCYQLVKYVLRGDRTEATREGFLVLRPELDGWSSAETTFDAGELYAVLKGECEEILVNPVCIHVLTGEQREALLDSAARSRQDAAARSAWQGWLRRAVERSDSVTDEAWQLLCDVRNVLTLS